MFAVFVNMALVLVGSAVGLLLKNRFSERMGQAVMKGLGLCTVGIGMSSLLGGKDTLCTIICVALGTILGEWLNIEKGMDDLGELLRRKLIKGEGNSRFVEGFVNASVLFCVGAMTIMGAIQDGLGQGYSILLTKSSLDFIASIILAASLGVGVLCSALTVLLYQGGLTLLAGVLQGVLAGALLDQLCMVGYAIVLCIGINFFGVVKIKTASLLPALLVPLLYNVPMLLKTL